MPFRSHAGHRNLIRLIARAAIRGELPPSLVFDGPRGVGKRSAAVSLAQLFNCANPVTTDPEHGVDACGECAACRRIGRGVHADVLVVEPGESGSIKVDQARQVVERSAYRPFEGRRRVVVLDDADAMEVAAQNALLKTLEEPPAASTFVLVTSRPDILLPTVRSRCQRLRFGRLTPGEVAGVLIRDFGFAEPAAHVAASVAGGSVGMALECDTDSYTEAREKAVAALRLVAVRPANPRGRLSAAKLLGGDRGEKAGRDDLGRRLRVLSSMLRDLGLLGARADERAIANADERESLTTLLPAFDASRTVHAFSAVDRALSALDRNASPRIVADWLAFQI